MTDSFGGTGLIKIQGEVRETSDLPPSAPHGWIVKVQNHKETTEDDYWVQSVTEAGKGFGTVKEWPEAVAPAMLLDYSKSTLPHILTRRQDDAGGSVTLTPYQIYFEYDFGQWQSRAVGDNDSNPYPSFVGQASSAIAESRSRLDLAGGNKTSFSEVNNLWNFFQTRIAVNLDSDPIDNNNQAPTAANYIRPTVIQHLQPFKNRLLVFGDSVIFSLEGDPILTGKTIFSKAVADYDSLPNCHPTSSGASVFSRAGRAGLVASGKSSHPRSRLRKESSTRAGAFAGTSRARRFSLRPLPRSRRYVWQPTRAPTPSGFISGWRGKSAASIGVVSVLARDQCHHHGALVYS